MLNIAQFYSRATLLSVITILYNIAEGLISIFFAVQDETLALFGFGIDSFVEVISAVGIWHMVIKLKRLQRVYVDSTHRDKFENTALKITGSAFYLLAISLIFSACISMYISHKPDTTLWGIIISIISISFMWFLIYYKIKLANQYNSRALLADAQCSKSCMYLSIVLLISSVGYEITNIAGFDALGAIGIAYFAIKEGREAFDKASGKVSCCQCQCEH